MNARALLTAFVLFGGVGLLITVGGGLFGLSGAGAARGWLTAARGPWALPGAVACFSILAFLGAPQIVLIAAAAAVYGPAKGAIYSWIGTFVSSLIGYGLGRLSGARALTRLGGERTERLMALIRRNGFLASLVIRLVPFAPFVVVNMAAGVAEVAWPAFAAGTGLGIIPKIAATALAGGSLGQIARGGSQILAAALVLAAVLVWLASGWAARRWLRGGDGTAIDQGGPGAP